MFDARTVLGPSELEHRDEKALRLLIATYLLGQMLPTGGLKQDKVKAAFEYADLLIKNGRE